MSKTKQVFSNVLKQNVYVRDCVDAFDLRFGNPCCKYYSLDDVVEKDGIKQVVTEQDYPVTPESVNSYRDGCDYRLDPLGAIARGEKRQNLGDVRQMQEVMRMDAEEAAAQYALLKQRFEAAASKKDGNGANEGEAGEAGKEVKVNG